MDADKNGYLDTWIVLYDSTAEHLNENEIEIINKNAMGSLKLGKEDSYINWSDDKIIAEADLDNNGVDDIEKAIYSYNNCIETLNNYCDSLIKIDNLGVRSVGTLPTDPYHKETTITHKPALGLWQDKTTWNKYGVLGEDEDSNYEKDYEQMKKLGIEKAIDSSETTHYYWIGSRKISNLTGYNVSVGRSIYSVGFEMRQITSSGALSRMTLYETTEIGTCNLNTNTDWRVRPVIKLSY